MHKLARSIGGALLRGACLLALGFLASCAGKEERAAEAIDEADALLFEGDTQEAIRLLQRGSSDQPDHAGLREALGRALLQAGAKEDALAAFESALDNDPMRDHLWIDVAELRMELGREQQAIGAFKRHLANRGDDFLAWKHLSEASASQNDFDGAIDAALEWYDARPSARSAHWLGELFHRSGNVPQARAWLAQAAAFEDDPQAGEALVDLIDLEISLRQYLQAETWLKRLEARHPDTARQPQALQAKDLLSKWRQAQRELAAAAEELEARRRGPQRGDRTEPDASPPPELEEAPSAATAEAEAAPEPEPEADPQRRPPSPLFGQATTESFPTSASEPLPAAQRREGGPAAQAQAALEGGRFAQAIDAFWDALGLNPDSAQLWHGLALAYYRSENYSDAESCILEARRREPGSESINVSYLQILLRTQGAFRAAEEAGGLAQRFPRSARIAYLRARSLRDSRASPIAVASAYRRFLELADSNSPGYREARRYLGTEN